MALGGSIGLLQPMGGSTIYRAMESTTLDTRLSDFITMNELATLIKSMFRLCIHSIYLGLKCRFLCHVEQPFPGHVKTWHLKTSYYSRERRFCYTDQAISHG